MNTHKEYSWHKLAESFAEISFNEKGFAVMNAAGKRICVVKYKDELYACAAACPHAGGMMSQGYIDAMGNIVCPLHRYKFSLQNGRNISGEGYYLKTWPVETRADGIYIGMDKSSFF